MGTTQPFLRRTRATMTSLPTTNWRSRRGLRRSSSMSPQRWKVAFWGAAVGSGMAISLGEDITACDTRFCAGMAKLADAADLKSAGPQGLWGFKSPSRHQQSANLQDPAEFLS